MNWPLQKISHLAIINSIVPDERFLNKVPQVIGNHFIHDTIHSCRHVYDVVDRLRGRGSGRGWERAGLPGAKLGPRREAGVRGVDRRRGKRSTIHTLSKAFCVLNVNKVRAPFSGIASAGFCR